MPITVGPLYLEKHQMNADQRADRYRTVVARLERLPTRARLAFVSDLWAARGFETRVEAGVVRAERRGRSVRIRPVFGRRSRASAAAERDTAGVRHLDAGDIAEALLYAIDRQDADAVCRRQFGASLDDLRPPLRMRARRRVRRLGDRTAAVGRDAARGITALFVVVAVVSGAAVALDLVPSPLDGSMQSAGVGTGGAGESGPPTATPERDDAAAEEPSETAATETASGSEPRNAGAPGLGSGQRPGPVEPIEPGELERVPGVGPDGIENLTALSAAHERALADESYTLWVDIYRPEGAGPNSTRRQYDTDIAVAGERYVIAETVESGRERTRLETVYYDGDAWYVAETEDGVERTRRVNGNTTAPPVQFEPRGLNRGLVRQYLDTRATNVTGKVTDENVTYYRIEGSQRPAIGGVEPVQDYQFVAHVDEQGFVADATATYALVSDEGFYWVRFEWTYGRVGETTVAPPAWVEGVENGTVAGMATTADSNRPPALRTPA
ncbi:hypothetical protein [Haloferax sp. Atlit-10N]|uniref:hypothetical protein n=2 Tax=unclassified Haloferax TaxID=2625095 RepID=UPI001F46581B|nr:hypothetical protein [Haloferax sp. Atlit-10N]